MLLLTLVIAWNPERRQAETYTPPNMCGRSSRVDACLGLLYSIESNVMLLSRCAFMLTLSMHTPAAHSFLLIFRCHAWERSLELRSWQVPKRGLHRPVFSHPLLFHRPSQRCLVLLFVMHVVARWQTCLHPSHLLCKKKCSVIRWEHGKE